MLAAILSHVAVIYHNEANTGKIVSYFNHNASSFYCNLITDQMWALDPNYEVDGLSYPLFTKHTELLRPCIPAQTISMPLHSLRLSQGYKTKTITFSYKFDPWMITKITNVITRVLSTKLFPIALESSGQRLLQFVQGFKELTGLLNIYGAIDGSHHKRPSNEFNCKCRHTIFAVLRAVSDHRMFFQDICVKAPGDTDDSAHFRDSSLFNKLI
eukprot:Gb_19401 [translate_table: standard]